LKGKKTMDEATRKRMKTLVGNCVSVFDGEVISFFSDQACRQQVCVAVLKSPAFEVGDDQIPRLTGLNPTRFGAAPAGGDVSYAKIGPAKGIRVEKTDGANDKAGVIFVRETEIPKGGNVDLVAYWLAVNEGTGETLGQPAVGHQHKCMAVVNVIPKAAKDAAFNASRAALPDSVTDDAIRGLTEHGATWEQVVKDLAPAEDIPDAEPLDNASSTAENYFDPSRDETGE
jgi:hypothetical protein